jgi:hypothetical protein
LRFSFFNKKEKEVRFVISSGGMKCDVVMMREKEEREDKVKENGKVAIIDCLCYSHYGNGIAYRMKEGWKGEEIMREMMWMIEEEDVKESLFMLFPYGINSFYGVPAFNYGLGMCLHVR